MDYSFHKVILLGFRKAGYLCLSGLMISLLISTVAFQPLFAQQLGNTRWVNSVPNFDDSLTELYSGTPSVSSDGTIFVTAPKPASNSQGTHPALSLYAYSTSGDTLWKTELRDIDSPSSFQSILGPIIGPQGSIYVLLYNQISSSDSTIFAVNSDGSIRWEYSASTSGSVLGGGMTVGPNGTVYLAGTEVLALSDTGTVKWSMDSENPKTAPVVDGNGHLYYISTSDSLISLSSTGNSRWQYEFSQTINPNTTLAITEKNDIVVPVAADDKVVSIRDDGSKNWEFDDQGNLQFPTTNFMYSPIVTSDNKIVFADHQETLYALNPNGTLGWSRQLPFTDFNDPGFSTTGVTLSQGSNETLYVKRLGPIFLGTELLSLELGASGEVKWRYLPDSIAGLGIAFPPKINSNNLYFTGVNQNQFRLHAVVAEAQDQAQSSWPISVVSDNQNTFRAGVSGDSCGLLPNTKIFPPILNQHFGHTFLFLTGFEESDNQPSDVEASTLKLGGAEPEKWHGNSHFLWLKYDNEDVEIGETTGGWFFFKKTELAVEGELSDGGCFETSKEVFVW